MTPAGGLRRIVIVGASAAGLTAAETLRADGFDGDLTLVGAEDHLPYDRPPLSKHLLAGTWAADRLELLPRHRYDDLQITLRLGSPATALDVARRTVRLDEDDVPYDALLVTTGVRPRTLPGGDALEGVHTLRTIQDALAFKDDAQAAGRVVIVGAGFLGAEAAATLRGLGVSVTLVDPLSGPMVRQVGPTVSQLVADLHIEHDVELRMGVAVEGLTEASGRVTGVRLGDGTVLATTCVLVAIGTVPATEWLADSGVDVDDGVACDERCRAAPGVFAAGDVARWFHRTQGKSLRIEHRTNATQQAVAAAQSMLGDGKPYEPVPYFWSDQYDTKIQVHGVAAGAARFALVHGSFEERRFVALYGRGDRVIGALGWRSPRELLRARALVADAAPWQEAMSA